MIEKILEELRGVEGVDYVICQLCGKRFINLPIHLGRTHNISKEEYLNLYPNSLIMCDIGNQIQENGLIKHKKTVLERYGVNNISQSNEIKQKKIDTCIDNYGVKNPFQFDIIKDKMKKTCLGNYGVENPMQSDVVKNKVKETTLDRYGVEYASQSNIIKQKKIKTCLNHYGTENISQSNIIKEKKVDTCLIRYGVNNPFCIPEIAIRSSAALRGIDLETEAWLGFLCDLYPRHSRVHVLPEYKCIKLNNRFFNSCGHHILFNVIIYIPNILHQHIWHNMKTGQGMEEINALAFQYLNGCYDG